MCYQDVRMGRAKTPASNSNGGDATTDGVKIVGSNPNRASLVVTFASEPAASAGSLVLVRSGGAGGPILAAVDDHQRTAVLDVETYGRAVLAEVWAQAVGAGETSIAWTDIVWLSDPGEA